MTIDAFVAAARRKECVVLREQHGTALWDAQTAAIGLANGEVKLLDLNRDIRACRTPGEARAEKAIAELARVDNPDAAAAALGRATLATRDASAAIYAAYAQLPRETSDETIRKLVRGLKNEGQAELARRVRRAAGTFDTPHKRRRRERRRRRQGERPPATSTSSRR